jgi:hypothetical protein
MNKIRVAVHLVDGGLLEFAEGMEFLRELDSLQSQRLAGKELIHELLTDDWAAPPRVVEISGTAPDGTDFNVLIPYT